MSGIPEVVVSSVLAALRFTYTTLQAPLLDVLRDGLAG